MTRGADRLKTDSGATVNVPAEWVLTTSVLGLVGRAMTLKVGSVLGHFGRPVTN